MTPDELKQIRASLGLTQKALGKLLHKDRNTITRWEMGQHPIGYLEEEKIRSLKKPKQKRGTK